MSNRRFQLTWHKPRKCWSKFYKSRRYYCPVKCSGKTDREGYLRSLEWWYAQKFCLDRQESRDAEVDPLIYFNVGDFLKKNLTEKRRATTYDTIDDLIDAYLEMLRHRVDHGNIESATYEDKYTKLKTFKNYLNVSAR